MVNRWKKVATSLWLIPAMNLIHLIGIMHILNWTPRSQTTEWYIGME